MSFGELYEDGSRHWLVDGEYHRLDGPAIIYATGSKIWFQNGLRHRLDGPAITDADGSEYWYQDGQRHRIDGPAIIWPDGSEDWCVDNCDITFVVNEWIDENNIGPWEDWTDADKLIFMMKFK